MAARARADAHRGTSRWWSPTASICRSSRSRSISRGDASDAASHARPGAAGRGARRVTRPGGTILVVDQLAPADPLVRRAAAPSSSVRATRRPPASSPMPTCAGSSTRTAWRSCTRRSSSEPRDLEAYLDLAGCEGVRARRGARPRAATGYRRCLSGSSLPRRVGAKPGRARAPAPGCEAGTSAARRSPAVLVDCHRGVAGRRAVDGPRVSSRAAEALALREAFCLDEPGVHGVDRDAARSELGGERARERELRVLRRRVRPLGDGAGDRHDVDDDASPAPRPGRNASVVQTEPR